jgi:hypothetical protein
MAGGTQPWRRTFGLCGPPVLLSLTDWTLIALGQPAAYWAGDYSQANELSPTFHNLLAGHPALFALGVLAWVAAFVALIVLLPDTPAVMLSLAVAFGHANGAASWLRGASPYQARIALVCLTAALAGLGVRLALGSGSPRRVVLPAWVRWGLVAALLAFSAYLFLVPRR